MNDLRRYETFKPLMNTGDLIEFKTRSAVGWAIRKITKKDVNHSALLVKFDYDGCGDRRYILEAVGRGVDLNILSKRLMRHKGSAYWSMLKKEHDDKRQKILGFALSQLGVGYDYRSILDQIVGRVSSDIKKYFCSEYVQVAYEQAGVMPVSEVALRPGDFQETGVICNRLVIL